MTTMRQVLGPLTEFKKLSNLNLLPNGQAKPLGVVSDFSPNYPWAKVHLIINLAESGLAEFGVVELYLIGCISTFYLLANSWSDGIQGDTTVNMAANVRNSRLIKTFSADPTMNGRDIQWVCNDLGNLRDRDDVMVGDLPPFWSLVVFNKSGAAFQSSGHTAVYQMVGWGS